MTTYSHLAEEINQPGNIKLKHKNYTYDTGATTITITEENKVIDGDGAVIDMAGSSIRAFTVTASNVTIKNLTIKNANFNGDGGAIYFEQSGIVEKCSFKDNYAIRGGAISFFTEGDVGECYFTGNIAEEGGAVWMLGGEVYRSIFERNSARDGGAIACSIFDRIEILRSTFNFQSSAIGVVGCTIKDKDKDCAKVEDCHFNYCRNLANVEFIRFIGCYFIEFTLDEARKVVDGLNHKNSYVNAINADKFREIVDALAETVSVASYGGACCKGRHSAFEEFLRNVPDSTRLLQLYASSTYGIRPNTVCREVFEGEVAYRNFDALLGLLPAVLSVLQRHIL